MAQKPLYKQANAPIEERIKDLMERMTVEEKVGQLCCPMGWEMYTKTGNKVEASELYKKQMGNGMPIGSYWAVLRADPWTQKTLENGLTPELAAEALNKLQKFAVEETRLGIPVLFAEETPHGHMAIGATVFPTGLSMASTWNPELLRRAGEVVALEARLQGANVGYGPVLDISREPRWSRMEVGIKNNLDEFCFRLRCKSLQQARALTLTSREKMDKLEKRKNGCKNV